MHHAAAGQVAAPAPLDADLLGAPAHLEMRQTQSRAVMEDFKA